MERFAEPILHVDMDAFFVEVERLRHPELRDKPVVVGGAGRRAVVASASYEARRYGVRSAMPMVEAERRCPGLVRVAPDHARYSEVSREVFDVLGSFTPHVEALSVDEAFLDIGGLRLHFPNAPAVADAIRSSLRQHPGLPASVGIAPTKFLAKLASDAAKPNGVAHVHLGCELEFLHPLPIRRLWGVGPATRAALESLGVTTIGDIAELDEALLQRRLGPALGSHLARLAAGVDERPVVPTQRTKSVSVEETYERDLGGDRVIREALVALCHRLDGRMRRSAFRGHTVTLKMKFADFSMITRSSTSDRPVVHEADLIAATLELVGRIERHGRGVRLLGVALSGLERRDQPEQLVLDAQESHPAATVVDEIRERFGDDAVVPGRLLEPEDRTARGSGSPEKPSVG